MLKRTFILLFLSVLLITAVHGQHLTRVCVVDLPRVYQEFFRESRAVREFEDRSNRVQTEVNRRQNSINELKVRLEEARESNNTSQVNRLEVQINNQTESLREYFQAQTAILENQRRNLMVSGSFLTQVNDEIRFIAESEGFSIVMDIKANNSIVWYNPTIDITDKLIQSLRAKSSR
ncbi:MAG: OmpH family outer membrane protein [Treponema sp.]|jgi:outer membrane protein|nr:OmpH family outer membrane protein [Treponema sp.]